ncbi:HNH endonuclease signature motif containing protein [Mycobacterium sp. WMMD1722]|uniref:HNH endonuclease signature motif containing protein n=1 Tax=Mycobacterium sp. WMMD1722 TaxID=3404117 RepID=UPI003BF4FDD6
MSSAAVSLVDRMRPKDRLEVLFGELAQLCGQRNAIDGRIVEIAAQIEGGGLAGMTGARSVAALMAWKTGVSPRNAETLVAVARRAEQFPRCVAGLREGRLSLDQVGVIAENATEGSDAHYAQLAESATVTQLRTAVKLEARPAPESVPPRGPSVTTHDDGDYTTWKIRLDRLGAAAFEAALQSHRDALIADHDPEQARPFPTTLDAFTALVEAGWDAEAVRRPHGHRTTVVMHLDVEQRVGALHLGPLLSEAERRFLLCDATFEAWFHRDGKVIGAGRSTRQISRRLRRALEHRDRCCVVPGCGATRGLHAHHLRHWEDGGPTELDNLVLLCPYHHRLHHAGGITLTGPADRLSVTDDQGRPLAHGSLARPPTTAPSAVAPYRGPTGERADWWWYQPFQPKPPPASAS